MRTSTPLILSLLAGCHSSVVVGDLQEVSVMRAVPNPNLDILFVVDNSGSMTEQQASLAASFPRMIDLLEQLDGGLPNLHIGVVTSDLGTSSVNGAPAPNVGTIGNGGCGGVGDDGALHGVPALTSDTFIADVALADGTRQRNYTGALRDVFAEMAQVGTGGCGFEQHLSAMRRALTNPINASFLREDANLAVVIIADEDDCSVLDPALFGRDDQTLGPQQSFRCTQFGVQCDPDDMTTPGLKSNCEPRASSPIISDVQPFIDALVAAKGGDERSVMVAAIVGPPEWFEIGSQQLGSTSQLVLTPSCRFPGPMGLEEAAPAVRLAAFLDAFPGRSTLTSICGPDLSIALTEIGASAKKLVGDPCLDAHNLVDASPEPGLQPACEVIEIRDSAPGAPTVLPTCGPGASDCFEIAADPVVCPSAPENLRVRVRRGSTPAADTWTHVRCQLAK